MTAAPGAAGGTADEEREAGIGRRASAITAPTRTVAHTLATSVVRYAAGALWAVVVARTLGPDGRGGYAVLQTIAATAVALGHLSVDAAHTSLWSRARPEGRAAIAANGVVLGCALGSVAAISAAAVVFCLGSGLVPIPGHGLLLLALLAIPPGVSSFYVNNVLVLRGQVQAVNRSTLAAACVPTALLLAQAMLGRVTIGSVTGLWLLGVCLPLLVTVPVMRPRPRDRDARLAMRALGVGLRYHVGTAALFLLVRADVLILNGLTSPVAVGVYAVAVTAMELTGVVAGAIAQVMLPRQMDADRDLAAKITASVTRLTVPVTALSVALMCLMAPLVLPLVYGERFGGAVAPLLCLAPGMIAYSGSQLTGAFLLRLGRPAPRSAAAGAALAVSVVLDLLLIPVYGVVGCAVASSAGYCALAAAYVAWFSLSTGISPRSLLPGRIEVRYFLSIALRLTRKRSSHTGPSSGT